MTDRVKELAKNTTHDLYNQKINLSTEEKFERIKAMFLMVSKFEKIRGVKCGKVFFETTLLPRYINTKPQRLSRMFKWLCDNWQQYSKDFPDIPDFEDARRQTAENNQPDTFDKNFVNQDYPFEELSKEFREVREQLPQKKVNEIRKYSQVALYRRMANANMVFSVDKCKWVPREGLGPESETIDPRPVVAKLGKKVIVVKKNK